MKLNITQSDGGIFAKGAEGLATIEGGKIVINVPAREEAAVNYRLDASENARADLLIQAGAGSRLTFAENLAGTASADLSVEIVAAEGAKIDYVALQEMDESADVTAKRLARLGEGAEMKWITGQVGAGKAVSLRETFLEGRGARAEDTEVFFCSGQQEYNITANMFHRVPDTTGNVLVKGILAGSSRASSKGMIKIEKDAQRTNSYLSEHTLLLSRDARAEAVPGLEIEANDVKASHSASVSRIDDEHVFYLVSRGLDEREAKKMLVLGFLRAALGDSGSIAESIGRKWSKVMT